MKIAILDDYQGVATGLADWASLQADITVFRDTLIDADAIAERLAPFDTIVAMRERTRFPAEMLARLPNLKLLVTTGLFNAAIDVAAAKAQGITVSGTRMYAHSTAPLVWGLILSLARHIHEENRRVHEGGWQQTIGLALHGKMLGLVGAGNLGQEVAKAGRAFGMKIQAWSPNLTQERADAAGVALASREDLFATSDIISIHMVLSPRTRGLIGAADLGRMKKTAYLINTSRGPLVDETALVAALRERRIAGAGLDVFDQEPLPVSHPLRGLDNALLTPHLGYVTEDDYRIAYQDAVENIRTYLAGAPLRVIEPR